MIKIVSRNWCSLERTVNSAIFYVGRPSHLGNPYQVSSNTKLETVLKQYERYLKEKLESENPVSLSFQRILNVACEKDVALVCFCAPKKGWTTSDPIKCHAQVIARELESRLQ